MKLRLSWLLTVVLALLCAQGAVAQHVVSDSIYIPPAFMPKGSVFLPAPPDSVSPEFVEKSGAVESVAPVAAAQQSSARTYLLDGTLAPDRTRGIVIQDHRKTVRK